ncbi:hypothetical protein [Piscibacillus salipiscarius]|uniref:hypothetical protein n=1 Tax=Piscibacillus salipiscarius TaxID=299480 RepID=UPI0006D1A643|nr:hypothetical protein [Piscibacillus salipiscarius]
MKKVMIILLLGSFILTLAACDDTSDDEKELKEFVTDYKSKLYNIENPNLLNEKHPTKVSQKFSRKIEPYETNEVLEDLTLNRQLIIIPQIAQALGKKVKLQDISLEKVKENEDGSINYDYTMKIKYYDDESENIVKKW